MTIVLADPIANMAPIVLASASAARAALLRAAGVTITVDPAAVDEAEVKRALRAEGASSSVVAETLAELKAQRTARRHPGTLVIGADQVLDFAGTTFDKPANLAEARAQLLQLCGQQHELISA
ncbi:MAG: Maf family protein, partial [Dongiaceae bacterium]